MIWNQLYNWNIKFLLQFKLKQIKCKTDSKLKEVCYPNIQLQKHALGDFSVA